MVSHMYHNGITIGITMVSQSVSLKEKINFRRDDDAARQRRRETTTPLDDDAATRRSRETTTPRDDLSVDFSLLHGRG